MSRCWPEATSSPNQAFNQIENALVASKAMNSNRTWRFQYRLPQPLPEGAMELTMAEAERELLRQLEQSEHNPSTVLWELARLYNATGRQEQALQCLRRVLAGESDLEAKAGCVLALGQTMERTGDFPGAIRYYREALVMEPARTETWYFIHNNLGYSCNQVGQHEEAERFCRSAIAIAPDRHNAHKNLGIALTGLGRYREAAQCFITATQKCANDPRATEHLHQLLEQHPELNAEFEGQLNVCQRALRYVAETARRAQARIAVRILLGGSDPSFSETVTATLRAVIQRGSVEVVRESSWAGLIKEGSDGTSDLVVFAPHHLDASGSNPLSTGLQAVKFIASRSPAPIVVFIAREDPGEWCTAFREAGADEVLELPCPPNLLAEALKRCIAGHREPV
jgi:tetratricopeptide (TPR) repeat protein